MFKIIKVYLLCSIFVLRSVTRKCLLCLSMIFNARIEKDHVKKEIIEKQKFLKTNTREAWSKGNENVPAKLS